MIIDIKALTFDAIIGILESERHTAQTVIIDVKISYTFKDTVFINYADIANYITRTMQEERFELIETSIAYLQKTLHAKFPNIETLFLSIAKPDILDNCIVSVSDTISFL